MRTIPLVAIWAIACNDGAGQTSAVDATPDVMTRSMLDAGLDQGRDVQVDPDTGSLDVSPDVLTDAAPDLMPLLDAAPPDQALPDAEPVVDAEPDTLAPDMSDACEDDDACPIDARCEDGVCVVVPPAADCDDPIWINAFNEFRGALPERPDAMVSACHEEVGGAEVVFAVNLLEFEGTVCASTAGSTFDTLLHVRAGDCRDSANEIRCSNDIGGQRQAQLDFFVEPNQTYFLVLDAVNAEAQGDYRLEFFFGPCMDLGCEFDMDCQPDEICVNGSCEMVDEGCEADDDCPPGRACEDGMCQHQGLPCADDGDCVAGQVCVDAVCKG